MIDTLLATKLYIPSTRPELVKRPRLNARITECLHRKLTLVSAPAGFGKTTLVAECLEHLPIGDHQKIWLSLDEADNDLSRFLSYFIAAVKQAEEHNREIGDIVLQMLQSSQVLQSDVILTAFINEISALNTQIVFVLDDYHVIEDDTIHKALNFWLENSPPNFHLIIITREDPPLSLPRLRARDEMTELRVADLRFSESEAAEFLNEVMGFSLDANAISMLEERTEGWIAGLQMAALSMRNREDAGKFIEGFSGSNRYILDYLMEEVLANQAPETQQFLLQTSILKRLKAPLCDAVIDKSGYSLSALEYLERANLFLLPLDDERSWYRYHHLFADLLQARLKQAFTEEEVTELHTRAAQWHEQNGLPYGAIYHASLTSNLEWVERLIDQNYMEIFQRKDSGSIRYWTGELSGELIYKRPRLSIYEAMSCAWLGKLDEAELFLSTAEKRLQEMEPTPDTKALYGHFSYVKSRVTAMGGDFQKAIELCLAARECTPASNQGLLGGIGVMLGYGYFLNGDFEPAVQALQDTVQIGKTSGAINTTSGAYCVLGRLRALQGRLRKAYDLYREAEAFIQALGEHRGAISVVHIGLAEIYYEWNDLENALIHIQQGLEYLPFWSKADDIALAQILYSKIQQASGNLTAAEEAIEKGADVVLSNGVFSEARDAVSTAQIRIRLEQDPSLMPVHLVGALHTRLDTEQPFRFENELVFMALARVYLHDDNLSECLELLSQLEAGAQAAGRASRLIEIMNLQAVALHRIGKDVEAHIILKRALSLAAPEGYLRTFLDEGQPMQELLRVLLDEIDSTTLKNYALQLLSHFDDEIPISEPEREESGQAGGLLEPLSAREVEVLELIGQGKTNKEIAGQLIISAGTVKAHTSSIYRKLDVANRTEAVARARQLDILS